jgi:hypothetical protein
VYKGKKPSEGKGRGANLPYSTVTDDDALDGLHDCLVYEGEVVGL